jgi:hypothetical protein
MTRISSLFTGKHIVNVYQLAGYNGSRDYGRLADLARVRSIICIVDYQECRDVAHTIFTTCGANLESWCVSGRGIGYVHAFNRADFIARCEAANLEFIEPPQA